MTSDTDNSSLYGCDNFGRLKRVLLHKPGKELEIINKDNCHYWLFDNVPDIDRFKEEHDRYKQMLIGYGVEVLELADYVHIHKHLIEQLPNITYLHDIAVVTSSGAILSSMVPGARRGEEFVVREALNNLGIPILIDFNDPLDAFEGCLLLSPQTILVAETERHNRQAVDKFIPKALAKFDEVIYVQIPKARRYMHADTIYNRIKENIALAYLPAFLASYVFTKNGCKKIDFAEYMKRKGIEIISVSDSEQQRLACTFVPLEPGIIFHYDTALDKETQVLLARKGIEIIPFHPDALLAGGGSLRCITLRLLRVPV